MPAKVVPWFTVSLKLHVLGPVRVAVKLWSVVSAVGVESSEQLEVIWWLAVSLLTKLTCAPLGTVITLGLIPPALIWSWIGPCGVELPPHAKRNREKATATRMGSS